MSGARSRFVDVEGVRLHAVDEGPHEGRKGMRPVLVLHGFTGGAASMSCVSEPLIEARRVVRLELIGHGGSDAPESREWYAMSACVRQVAAAIEALGLERPHVIGYSMGGRTALATAVAYPERIGSLTLIGATAGIADPVLRRERIASDEALADRIESEGLEAFVDHWMALPIFASQKRLGSEALARAREERLANSARGLANSLRGMGAGAQEPVFDRLGRYPGPILLAVGEEDAKFREIAIRLRAGSPSAEIVIVPGAGHAAHLEAPEVFALLLASFLARVEEIPAGAKGESE